MTRPSVWRCEFQQLDMEYINKRAGCRGSQVHTRPVSSERGLQFGVTRTQHGGKPRGLFLAPATFARLFKMPMVAHFLQGALPVDLLLQSPQRPIHGLAFFQPDLGQLKLTSSPGRPTVLEDPP